MQTEHIEYNHIKSKNDLENLREGAYENTALHEAILRQDNQKLRYFLELGTPFKSNSVLNVQSCGNTPLMLAIKTANFEAALLLLQQENINVNLHDFRGFQAIHWACIFRANEVIQAIYKHNPKVFIAESAWFGGESWSVPHKFLREITPFMLYQFDWPQLTPEKNPENVKILEGNGVQFSMLTIKHRGQKSNFFKQNTYNESDYKLLCMTDMLFHMQSICKNLRFLIKELESTKAVQYEGSACNPEFFQTSFEEGYPIISLWRNDISITADLAEQLQDSKYHFQLSIADAEFLDQCSKFKYNLQNEFIIIFSKSLEHNFYTDQLKQIAFLRRQFYYDQDKKPLLEKFTEIIKQLQIDIENIKKPSSMSGEIESFNKKLGELLEKLNEIKKQLDEFYSNTAGENEQDIEKISASTNSMRISFT